MFRRYVGSAKSNSKLSKQKYLDFGSEKSNCTVTTLFEMGQLQLYIFHVFILQNKNGQNDRNDHCLYLDLTKSTVSVIILFSSQKLRVD